MAEHLRSQARKLHIHQSMQMALLDRILIQAHEPVESQFYFYLNIGDGGT
jgi:hypothetical protein